MRISSLFPHARSCRVDDVRVSDGALTIALTSTRTTATCPSCRRRSRHPHSRYRRRVADQPWAGHPVTVVLHGRRFLCRTPQCPRRTFRERFPALVAPCARRSDGLRTALARIGLAAGGEAGARLAAALGMPTSASTLLRAVRAVPAPAPAAPSIVGLDDWSRRRGRRFGTIVVDLERHRPVDLLPDRHADSVAAWLAGRPGITVVARDRSDLYADGIARGAPQAVQVVDRFHVLKNLEEALERFLQHKRAAIEQAAAPVATPAGAAGDGGCPTHERPPWQQRAEEDSQRRHAPWVARYEQVLALRARHVDVADIARMVGVSRQTVYRYLSLDAPPPRRRHATRRQTLLDPYKGYLLRRWDEGCRNAMQLWREIRARGFAYSYTNVSRFLAQYRPPVGQRPSIHRRHPAAERPPAPRHVAFLLIRRPSDLTPDERAYVDRLCQADGVIQEAYALAQDFATMLRERHGERLDAWIATATGGAIPDLRRFAAGLGADRDAVQAGLTLPWSNGQTEAHIGRLKMLKRHMFGRAGFELLRQRVLQCA
jgi:transposase